MRGVSRGTSCVDEQIQQLVKGCSALGIELNGEKRGQFSLFLETLFAWNRKINLISRKDTEHVAFYHFLDSLSILPHVEIPIGAEMIDVGTGAGFPGIPLKILRSDLRLTLVESTRKKGLFLKHVISRLNVSEVEVLQARAETLHRESKYQNRYDVAVARAVSPLKSLILLCLPFLKNGGLFVAYKGANVRDELQKALPELSIVSGRFARRIEIVLPVANKKRQILVFNKV